MTLSAGLLLVMEAASLLSGTFRSACGSCLWLSPDRTAQPGCWQQYVPGRPPEFIARSDDFCQAAE
jgi:hypothetical protein